MNLTTKQVLICCTSLLVCILFCGGIFLKKSIEAENQRHAVQQAIVLQLQFDKVGDTITELSDHMKRLEAQLEADRKAAIARAKKLAFQDAVTCLADNIYYEAGFEPDEGKAAVAQVTINRMNDPHRPHSVCGVVYERGINKNNNKIVCQFSWTCKVRKHKNSHIYSAALQMAKRFLTKKESSDIIGPDVQYYHADYVVPKWAAEKELIVQIGDHIFYK